MNRSITMMCDKNFVCNNSHLFKDFCTYFAKQTKGVKITIRDLRSLGNSQNFEKVNLTLRLMNMFVNIFLVCHFERPRIFLETLENQITYVKI